MATTPYRWPGGRLCAAVLSFDFDGEAPYLWNHRAEPKAGMGEIEQRRFGPRQGVYRILDLLAQHRIQASFYVPGWIAEHYPEALRAILKGGHEVGLHGYLHERLDDIGRDEMRETMARARRALLVVGAGEPLGYRSPSWEMTPWAFEVLQDLGVAYDSSLMGYDHPYWMSGLVEVPVQWLLDDAPFYRYAGKGDTRPPAHPGQVVESWRLELEGMKRFGGLFMPTMHPWMSGRAGRLLELDRLLARYRDDADIWWATAAQVARHHAATYPDEYREEARPSGE
ncbi:MAG: polysaccharide deacetylase family protein [Chloroflexota bacterium]